MSNEITIPHISVNSLFGWQAKVRETKGSFFILIKREIAVAAGIKRGTQLYSTFGMDQYGRNCVVSYLDRKSVGAEIDKKINGGK